MSLQMNIVDPNPGPPVAGHPGQVPPCASDRRGQFPSHRGPGTLATMMQAPVATNPSTRVMSPTAGTQGSEGDDPQHEVVHERQIVLATNALSPALRHDLVEARQHQGIQFIECELCLRLCYTPQRCCECQRVGHPACLRLHWFQGYLFCEPCLPTAQHRWNQARTEHQRRQWEHACNTVREMQIQWRVSFNGAADAAGSIVSGVAMTALTSTMRFASSVASCAS